MSNLKINQITIISLLSASLGLGLTACGGGGGGSKGPKVYNGVFKDSVVHRLSYVSGGQKGLTGKNGEFKYEEGANVAFSVGGVKLGTGKGKNIMTPVDLVKDGKPTSPEVLNRVRFLMMLDKDNNPGNGIEISEKVQKKAQSWGAISFAKDKFPSEKAGIYKTEASVEDIKVHNFPTSDEAKTHFSSTLEAIRITKRCSDAGAFTGTYSGSESGHIALILDPKTGDIKGSLFNTKKDGNFMPVVISKESAINYDAESRKFVSVSTSGLKFSGQLNNGNVLEGTWIENKKDSKKKGTFTAKRIGGNGGVKYRYNALYEGSTDNDLGILTVDVDAGSKLTGKAYDVKSGKNTDITGKVKDGQFDVVKLSDGGAIIGFISNTSLSGTLKEKSGSTNSFTGNGCKLN